ncbi:MAG: DUF3122 domain-containing protein [Cyanobacteria bacterium P01_F01_bin.150]
MYSFLGQVLTRFVAQAMLIIWLSLISEPLALAAPILSIDGAIQPQPCDLFAHVPKLLLPLARLEQHQEAPGQILYKAFATLRDRKGRTWRAIAFNHVLPDGNHHFKLRLVGFPGIAAIDRSKPLQVKTALGQSFTTPEDSDTIAIDEGVEAIDVPSNVAQYDMEAIAPRLARLIPLRLTLPLDSGDVRLLVLPNTIQEWKSVSEH